MFYNMHYLSSFSLTKNKNSCEKYNLKMLYIDFYIFVERSENLKIIRIKISNRDCIGSTRLIC